MSNDLSTTDGDCCISIHFPVCPRLDKDITERSGHVAGGGLQQISSCHQADIPCRTLNEIGLGQIAPGLNEDIPADRNQFSIQIDVGSGNDKHSSIAAGLNTGVERNGISTVERDMAATTADTRVNQDITGCTSCFQKHVSRSVSLYAA